MVVRISKIILNCTYSKYIYKAVFNTFPQNKCDNMDIKEKLKVYGPISLLILTLVFAGCVTSTPSGYAKFETVVLGIDDVHSIEQTKYEIELKDVTEDKCIVYIYYDGDIYNKAFFRYDNDNDEDVDFGPYRIRFVDGTNEYAKIQIYKEN